MNGLTGKVVQEGGRVTLYVEREGNPLYSRTMSALTGSNCMNRILDKLKDPDCDPSRWFGSDEPPQRYMHSIDEGSPVIVAEQDEDGVRHLYVEDMNKFTMGLFNVFVIAPIQQVKRERKMTTPAHFRVIAICENKETGVCQQIRYMKNDKGNDLFLYEHIHEGECTHRQYVDEMWAIEIIESMEFNLQSELHPRWEYQITITPHARWLQYRSWSVQTKFGLDDETEENCEQES